MMYLPFMTSAGWHTLLSPFNYFLDRKSASEDLIKVATITIVRIHQGEIGLAKNNHVKELLLPGRSRTLLFLNESSTAGAVWRARKVRTPSHHRGVT